MPFVLFVANSLKHHPRADLCSTGVGSIWEALRRVSFTDTGRRCQSEAVRGTRIVLFSEDTRVRNVVEKIEHLEIHIDFDLLGHGKKLAKPHVDSKNLIHIQIGKWLERNTGSAAQSIQSGVTVSYTHLTLPTIYSV